MAGLGGDITGRSLRKEEADERKEHPSFLHYSWLPGGYAVTIHRLSHFAVLHMPCQFLCPLPYQRPNENPKASTRKHLLRVSLILNLDGGFTRLHTLSRSQKSVPCNCTKRRATIAQQVRNEQALLPTFLCPKPVRFSHQSASCHLLLRDGIITATYIDREMDTDSPIPDSAIKAMAEAIQKVGCIPSFAPPDWTHKLILV